MNEPAIWQSSTQKGPAVLTMPRGLSAEDLSDVIEALEITLNQLRRWRDRARAAEKTERALAQEEKRG